MRYNIDPIVDCVFKALLGSEENKNLLVHFLNAVLNPESQRRIVTVDLLNPFNEREFMSDKAAVVDVKARDQLGTTYQIEIQMVSVPSLRKRIVYGWCDLYAEQLKSGEDYPDIKPVVSIWILESRLLVEDHAVHHHFRLYDPDTGVQLEECGGIHLLELAKWFKQRIDDDVDRWVRFFKEGTFLDDEAMPDGLNTPEMRQAMETLKRFSEKEQAYHLYQSRVNYLREQRAIQMALDAAHQEIEESRVREEALVREKEKLVAALRAAGIDPESL